MTRRSPNAVACDAGRTRVGDTSNVDGRMRFRKKIQLLDKNLKVNSGALAGTKIKVDSDSWGWALQAGVDINLKDGWLIKEPNGTLSNYGLL